jgi:hypothetical protein
LAWLQICVYKYHSASETKSDDPTSNPETRSQKPDNPGRLRQLADNLIKNRKLPEDEEGAEKAAEGGQKFLAVLDKLDQVSIS